MSNPLCTCGHAEAAHGHTGECAVSTCFCFEFRELDKALASISHNGPLPMLDVTAPKVGLEVNIRGDGKVVWINVDGVCVFRACQIPFLKITTPLHEESHGDEPGTSSN